MSISSLAPPFTTLEPGRIVAGKYEVLGLLGVGGAGYVVSARHTGLDDLVALKVLRAELAAQPDAVARFTLEARASFRIKNAHVARVLDVDSLPCGTPFMVMELLVGQDLRDLLDVRHRLPVVVAADFALQVCEALAAAHACQIVHRDIKPENVFITRSGDEDSIKVLDFGISKVLLRRAAGAPDPAAALEALAAGTPRYMAPEQVRAAEDLDVRADVWSLGCVVYEMLLGRSPFDRPTLEQSCAAVLQEEPPSLRLERPAVPVGLERVIVRCLSKVAAHRYQDVADLALALAPFGSSRALRSAERCCELLRTTPAMGPRTSELPSRPRLSQPPWSTQQSLAASRETIDARNRPTQSRVPPSAPQSGGRYPTRSRLATLSERPAERRYPTQSRLATLGERPAERRHPTQSRLATLGERPAERRSPTQSRLATLSERPAERRHPTQSRLASSSGPPHDGRRSTLGPANILDPTERPLSQRELRLALGAPTLSPNWVVAAIAAIVVGTTYWLFGPKALEAPAPRSSSSAEQLPNRSRAASDPSQKIAPGHVLAAMPARTHAANEVSDDTTSSAEVAQEPAVLQPPGAIDSAPVRRQRIDTDVGY